jgi:hypothetical protein
LTIVLASSFISVGIIQSIAFNQERTFVVYDSNHWQE